MIWVVAVALIASDGSVLMQRRRLNSAHGGLWEFPGGKIEGDETPEIAAFREIREELGVDLDISALHAVSFASDAAISSSPGSPLPVASSAPNPYQTHVILLYSCRRWEGQPACLDAEEIGWFAPEQLEQLAMPPLDYPLARALKKVI
jgi:8-oxo-dGTP diphosphatase